MTPEPVRFEQAALETILESLLADHPDAFVAAIDPEPVGRFVPIPSSLHLRGQAVLEARTALDLVVPADHSLGHATGDELLRIVADRLAIAVRADDALGRIGGDEFLVVCSGIRGVATARRVAERISRALCRPVQLAGATLDLQASLGVAFSGHRPITADALVARADAAMYESKRQGLGRPVVYSADLARTSPVA